MLHGADEWGATNGMKLVAVWEIIKQAHETYEETSGPAYASTRRVVVPAGR